MDRRYSAFMVRCWALGDGGQRAEIECIPTGERIAVESLDAALDWITARLLAPGSRGAAGARPDRERAAGEW